MAIIVVTGSGSASRRDSTSLPAFTNDPVVDEDVGCSTSDHWLNSPSSLLYGHPSVNNLQVGLRCSGSVFFFPFRSRELLAQLFLDRDRGFIVSMLFGLFLGMASVFFILASGL